MSSSLVSKVTSDDSTVFNAFAAKELAQLTLTSVKECDTIRSLLAARLNKKSPDVKVKALRAIKYISQHGRAEFRIGFQRDNAAIKELTTFRCMPDPLRGDAPAQHVREAASEALTAVFDSSAPAASAAVAADADRITGFGGGAPPPGSGAAAASGAERIIGKARAAVVHAINVMTDDKTPRSGAMQAAAIAHQQRQQQLQQQQQMGGQTGVAAAAAAAGGHGYSPGVYSTSARAGGDSERYGGYGSSANYKPSNSSIRAAAAATQRVAAGHGYRDFRGPAPQQPGAAADSYHAAANAAASAAAANAQWNRGTAGGGWADSAPAPAHSHAGANAAAGNAGAAPAAAAAASQTQAIRGPREPDVYEMRLIDDITTPSGVRPLPLPADLARFLDQCRALDKYAVARGLLLRCQSAPAPAAPAVATRALYVLEALLRAQGSDDADDAVNDLPQPLFAAEQQTEHRPLQVLASRCLAHAGLRTEAEFAALAAAAGAAAAAVGLAVAAVPLATVPPSLPRTAPPVINGGHSRSNSASAGAGASASNGSGEVDLFGLMGASAESSSTTAAATASILPGFDADPLAAFGGAAAATVADEEPASAFDFISNGDEGDLNSGANKPAPAAARPAPAAAGAGASLFSNMKVAARPPAAAHAATAAAYEDPFASLGLSGSDAANSGGSGDPLADLLGATSIGSTATRAGGYSGHAGHTGGSALDAMLNGSAGASAAHGHGHGQQFGVMGGMSSGNGDALAMMMMSSSAHNNSSSNSSDPFAGLTAHSGGGSDARLGAATAAANSAAAGKKAGPDSFSFVNDMM